MSLFYIRVSIESIHSCDEFGKRVYDNMGSRTYRCYFYTRSCITHNNTKLTITSINNRKNIFYSIKLFVNKIKIFLKNNKNPDKCNDNEIN